MNEEATGFTSLIKNSGFRYLWLNQLLVQLAYNTLNFTLIIWVFKLTQSNLAVSVLIMAMYLPAVVLGLFAGVLVDIADRRKLILLINLFLCIGLYLFVFIKGSYPLILVDTLFINSLAQFFIPAEGSSIPMLVPQRQLLLANSLFSLTLYGSFMIGFSIAGPILNFFGIDEIFYLGSGLVFLALLVSWKLPKIKVLKIDPRFNSFISLRDVSGLVSLTYEQMMETVDVIRGKVKISASIGLLACVQGIIGVLAVVMPSYLETVLHIHATDASYFVMVPLGLGMVLGALFIGRYAAAIPRRYLVVPAIVITGVLLLAAGLVPILASVFDLSELSSRVPHPRYFLRAPSVSAVFAFGAFLAGLCAVSIIIPSQTVLQESTSEKNRGKIFAVLSVIMYALSSIPVLLAGLVADLFGPTSLFVGLGLIVFGLGLVARFPARFFKEAHLPLSVREFLGLSHWKNL